MSDAVSTTGILVKRKALTPPASVVVTSSSVATPSILLTAAPHLLASGDTATIAGHTGSTPSLNNEYEVVVVDATHFSIFDKATGAPIAVTVGGTGGTVTAGFKTIGEIRDVGPGGKSRNKLESSIHNEGSESHVLGILRQKDPTIKINLVGGNATHLAVNSDIDNNVKNRWLIDFPSGIKREGDARVQTFDFAGAPVDGIQEVDFAITWAGIVTETFA